MDFDARMNKALRMARDSKLLVIDTETSGLDWKRNYIVGWVLTVDTDSVYVPVRHGGGGNIYDPNVAPIDTAEVDDAALLPNHQFEIELAKAFAQNPTQLRVGHNLKFDALFAAQRGVMFGRNLSCTMNQQCLVNEYTKSYSLESLAVAYGLKPKLSEPMYAHISNTLGVPNTKNAMAHFWRLAGNDPMATEYAEGDGITTWQLFKRQIDKLDNVGVGDIIRRVENELIWTLVRMERRGMRVDMAYLDGLKHRIEGYVAEALASMPEGFNVRSAAQVKEWMTNHGHTDWPVTEKGNASFPEGWLKQYEAGRKIVDIRKWSNLSNSFITPLVDTHIFKSRVHARVNQNKADDHGTISGRLSCSSPNLQQVPKHNKQLAKEFRKAFIADEGYKFYEADWSQAEPRLFAHYSGEPRLVDGYSETPFRDVHTIVAEMMKVDRGTTGKRMNMGMFTGMQPKTFSEHMKLPLTEATRLWNDWNKLFPKVAEFQNTAKTVMLRRGYVRTLLGRFGRLENPVFAYKATSKIIQGSQADMMKCVMVEIDKMLEERGDRTHLLMQVHDSLVWQAPDDENGRKDSAEIARMMEDVQTKPFNLRVPFVAEMEYGDNWAEASFGT